VLVSNPEDGFRLERINRAALTILGRSAPPEPGVAVFAAFPDDRELWGGVRAQLGSEETPYELELARCGRPGAEWIRVAASRIGSRVQIVLADVTAARRAEATLRRQEHLLWQTQKLEAMGTLASGIAHDFNNIFTSIILFCSGLGERGGRPGQAHNHDAREAARRHGDDGISRFCKALQKDRCRAYPNPPLDVLRAVRRARDGRLTSTDGCSSTG
jgi:signal transduction histidine kinase